MARVSLGMLLRPLWRRRRIPAAMDGWYDSRLPNGLWVRYRVEGGWIVTAYATAGTDPADALVARWGEDEVVTTYLSPPRRRRGPVRRLLGRMKEERR